MPTTTSPRRTVALLGLCVLIVTTAFTAAPPAHAADDPSRAPTTTLSADGRTVTGAGRTFVVSQARDLAGGGQIVQVSGAGFDTNKGIYVGLCVIPPTNMQPAPCGGGQNRTGTNGASLWISNNPPDYADGLTDPYGPGGSFNASIHVAPAINGTLDCYSVRCAIVTRNDHTRSSDRSQDLFIPVTFTTGASTSTPTTAAPGQTPGTTAPTTTMAPATTVPTTDPRDHAPTMKIAANGKSVTDGRRTLYASQATGLDVAGQQVRVRGEHFDPTAGIFVALCARPEKDQVPEPCTAPPDAAAWINDNPPDYGKDTARPFGPDGSFAVTLDISPVIDAKTDCRSTACVLAVRSDSATVPDRSIDLFLPVRFAAEKAETSTTLTSSSTTTSTIPGSSVEIAESDSGAPWAAIIGGVVVVAGLAVAATLVARRRSRGDGDQTDDGVDAG